MAETTTPTHPQWYPHAAVAGWLFPGLGHIVLGQKRRGIVLAVAITSLWVAGLLIGGISVIDRHDRGEPADGQEHVRSASWWFYGQAMIAPSIVIERIRDRMAVSHAKNLGYVDEKNPRGRLTPGEPADPLTHPPYEPSFGRVAEQGTLYTALAGMLNLLAIIDVLYCDAAARRRQTNITPVRPGNIAGVPV